ncbi:CinA family protein [Nocardia jinanensis]|uniref:Competence damage-inducible protein A n=1 Tax=Nocardia jinanensis TaxID=382504 RepID=A0A917RE05_9NOCA|nr:CinA family protein [Nocardia jinanensis]GGL01771.1 competence damage-inducible protein A [Nocardia jinanensis]
MPAVSGRARDHAEELAAIAGRTGIRVAVAESLTSGQLAAALGAANNSGEWFRGAVVAYSRAVKHHVLGVPEGPVVCEAAARAMAEGVRTLFEATVAVGVTGAGGPDPQDGQEPGSVWFAVAADGEVTAEFRVFEGEPAEILDQVVDHAVRLLLDAARKPRARPGAPG